MRPRTFQSRCLKSSPGAYSRCSTNSTLKPWRRLRFFPLKKPSTTRRAVSSRRARRAMRLESKNPSCGFIVGGFVLKGGGFKEKSANEVVSGQALCLGAKARDDPVAKDGERDITDRAPRDRKAPLEKRASLGGKEERLRCPRACSPGDVLTHPFRSLGLLRPRSP